MDKTTELIELLKSHASPDHLAKMKRFGIPNERALGVPVQQLRKIAKPYKRQHELALSLWETGWDEDRLMVVLL